MTLTTMKRAIGAGLACVAYATAAYADVKDYEFQLATPTVKVGQQTEFAVRLINKTTNKPVPDAVIFATRLDMAPDGMAAMATKMAPMPGGDPGTYKFAGDFSMAGRWQLSLSAKVQGETGTVESKFVIRADQ